MFEFINSKKKKFDVKWYEHKRQNKGKNKQVDIDIYVLHAEHCATNMQT